MTSIKKFFISFSIIILSQFINNYSFSVDPNEILKNEKQELRARNLSKNIRCLICQNQSIDDSSAPIAKDLRILIRDKIKEGKSNDEIYNFLTERYGDFILLKPSFKLNTLALWILPFIFLMLGILIVLFHNQKYKKNK